ncbi:hypothetical protein [Verrucomicrobium sp. BvORR106]|uniref:hypothetical protein n=1 Tax=Verrucomicrobium sp. BvORR106 TaxID=1403819 RepID=UPI000571CD15|nr:hypothetical protein [Verrucomicrobium sp. BvORR106]
MPAPKADVVKRFRKATRMGWMASKHFLMTESPELCERILEAGEKQPGADTLHDPIEDHPDYKEMIEALRETIEKEVREEFALENEERRAAGQDTHLRDWPLGTCHLMWRHMKDRLAAKGITWYSPTELNPGAIFD